jgi:hypothetical protein
MGPVAMKVSAGIDGYAFSDQPASLHDMNANDELIQVKSLLVV